MCLWTHLSDTASLREGLCPPGSLTAPSDALVTFSPLCLSVVVTPARSEWTHPQAWPDVAPLQVCALHGSVTTTYLHHQPWSRS